MKSPTITWRLRRIGGGLWTAAAKRPRAWLLAPRLRSPRVVHNEVPRPIVLSALHGHDDAPAMPVGAVLPHVDPLPGTET